MISAIILAAGKGTRLKSTSVNKVTLSFHGKPLVQYAVELVQAIASPTVIVVGAFEESVKESLKNFDVLYAKQDTQEGTAHAVQAALPSLEAIQPTSVFVGYGDHMMFYTKQTLDKMISLHQKEKSVMTLLTTRHDKPNELAWGRVVRDSSGKIIDNVEQKDINDEQSKITELNAGFYLFDYRFLKENIGKVEKSPVSGEYYINYLVKIAADQDLIVAGLEVPFNEVGIGINRWEELEASQNLYKNK